MENQKYYIVRANGAGVFAGNIKERNGNEVTMTNARRLWYWAGAASLSQLAMEGVKKPQECKFAMPVDEVTLFNVLEILACSDVAEENIKAVPVWKIK
jgi:hypothetical protein